MPNFKQRHGGPELLDQPDIPKVDLHQNLRELATINTWLGGHSAVWAGFKALFKPNMCVVELGSGGGDNLKYLRSRSSDQWTGIGVDLKQDCTDFAQGLSVRDLHFKTLDYRNFQPPSHIPTLMYTSLFCHHFSDEELLEMLKWLKEKATAGFFIADLHRHPLAYWSILFLTRCFSSSYLVKNDAPLSVLRGFKRNDWIKLLNSAGITQFQIKWIWAFRWVVIVPPQ